MSSARKKRPISSLWLYRYRFYILQAILAIGFAGLLVAIAFNSLGSISDAEMASAVDSSNLTWNGLLHGDIINLPFRLLQSLSIRTFGLTVLAVKLPSLILAAITGFFLILLINRWHKTNVAVIATLLAVPSAIFLGTAVSGTPAIMAILFPTIILWLGSKLVGVKNPSPVAAFALVAMLALTCYTPYFVYAVLSIPLLALTHPHLRLAIRRFGTFKLILLLCTFALFASPIAISVFTNFSTIKNLFVPGDLAVETLINNFTTVSHTLTQFTSAYPSPVLQPILGISLTLVALVGVVSVFPDRHASRYRVTTALLFFAVVTSVFDPSYVVTFFLPIAILIAAGINFILREWYSLFPHNPYPRVIGGLFVLAFAWAIIASNVTFFILAPHHIQSVNAAQNYQLPVLNQRLEDGAQIIVSSEQLDFYRILEKKHDVRIMDAIPEEPEGTFLVLRLPDIIPSNFEITQIITGDTYQNADLLYIYSVKTEESVVE